MSKNKKSKILFSVIPPEGNFRNVMIGQSYIQKFRVLNQSTKSITFRVRNPTTHNFVLSKCQTKKSLAPGLEMNFEVKFFGTEEKNYHDKITVITNKNLFTVPLNAYTPKSDIIFPSTFDMGSVLPNGIVNKFFHLQNYGSLPGNFRFEIDNSRVRVIPMEGTILPDTQQEIKVQYKAEKKAGVKHHGIKLWVENEEKRVELLVNIIEQNIYLYKKGKGKVEEIFLDKIYVGESVTSEVVLVNASSFGSTFQFKKKVTTVPDDQIRVCPFCGSEHGKNEDCEEVAKKKKSAFKIIPSKGDIKAFEEKKIVVEFHPKMLWKIEGNKDFEEIWRCRVSQNRFLELKLYGKCSIIDVELSEKKLKFHSVNVNDYRDMLVEVCNNSVDLPVKFKFNKIAHFDMNPKKGKLNPKQRKTIKVTFHPNQLGNFSNFLICNFFGLKNKKKTKTEKNGKIINSPSKNISSGRNTGKCIKKMKLYVEGSSESIQKKEKSQVINTMKLPSEFKKSPKFISHHSVIDKGEMVMKKHNQKILKFDRYASTTSNVIKLNELREKKKNDRKYNTFLRTMLRERKEKIIAKRSTCNNLKGDMDYCNNLELGMNPLSGLEPPPIPVIKLSKNRIYQNSLAVILSGTQLDESKISKKTFKLAPKTASEIRESQILLNSKQMKKLRIIPKTIDFGEVTVYGIQKKKFEVRNDLKQNVYVQVASKMKEFTIVPKSQVIPSFSQAGFEITLNSSEAQVIQQNLYFKVNAHNKMKMLLTAEINPARIDLSRDEIKFKFAENSLDTFIKESLTIDNKGNAVSEYEFIDKDPEIGEFTFEPKKGKLESKQSVTVNINFQPKKYQINKTIIFRVKGASKDLPIKFVADLKEEKLKCTEKKLDLGIFPVGMDVVKEITIKNIGRNVAVFNADNPSRHILVSPQKGKIGKKGTQKLILKLHPIESSVYKSELIISVRAGKKLVIPILGESITPSVDIYNTPELLKFKTRIGEKQNKKIQVKNVGHNICAVVNLDLKKNSNFRVLDENKNLISLKSKNEKIKQVELDDLDDPYVRQRPRTTNVDRYKLIIQPQEVLSFFLNYQPVILEKYEFPLGLYIDGLERNLLPMGINVLAESIK